MNDIIQRFNKDQAMTTADTDRERAIREIETRIIIAKKMPRVLADVEQSVLFECQDLETAEESQYSFPRGGQAVTGPSVRLAEVLVRHFGNMDYGIKELGTDSEGSTMEAFCWDMQSNVKATRVFHVKSERFSNSGTKKLVDPRDVYENNFNLAKRRQRACILEMIPKAIVTKAVNQCNETLKAHADATPEGIAALIEAFSKFGVTEKMIQARQGKNCSALSGTELVALRRIYMSLRDAMSKPDAWFDVGDRKSSINDTLKSKPENEPSAQNSEKLKAKTFSPLKHYIDQMSGADDRDTADNILSDAQADLSAADMKVLSGAHTERLNELLTN